MKNLLMTLVSLILSTSAFAGDAASLRSLGFSANEKYYAFLESGVSDGAGFPYADVAVIDVAKNSIVRSSHVMLEDEAKTVKQAIGQALEKAKLAEFGIVIGKNSGRTIVLHSRDEAGTFNLVNFSVSDWQNPMYELKLENKKLPDSSENQWCTESEGSFGLRLSITNTTSPEELSLVLQDDQSIPKSRGCVLSNSIAQVIVNGKALVVLVKTSSVGFEGPDSRYLAVTGMPALK